MNQYHTTLFVDQKAYQIFDLNKLPAHYQATLPSLPFCLKILLENILRHAKNDADRQSIDDLLNKKENTEINFTPSRVILQDFTGVPSMVDLAAMRDAMTALKADPNKINPVSPVDLVIDHSVMVDYFGNPEAFERNTALEFQRNKERYTFLKWGQHAFTNFRVVPPGTGIVHQVHLEYLAQVVFTHEMGNQNYAYPDTAVGTDSHTPMINGLGVLAWGVGGIEAQASMLGQPITLLIPAVIGFELLGQLPEGVNATDLVLVITNILRKKGVVGKFVEFFGEGLDSLSLADKATIANMAPEYGATCGFFPIDQETLNYLHLSGRSESQIKLIETYAKHQGLFRDKNTPKPSYTETVQLELSSIATCAAGPKRPHDLIILKNNKTNQKLPTYLTDGSVVIAAITSCTNTSNPSVMIAAALFAKAACDRNLSVKNWVKTSLAPGSQVVIDYLKKADLMIPLENLGFNLVGYGCTTCIGNSGPLDSIISQQINEKKLEVCAVLSGNRNFDGRIHPEVPNAYLASPPLVVAYALAGNFNINFDHDPLGFDQQNIPVYLKDLWPSNALIQQVLLKNIDPRLFIARYAHVFQGDQQWKDLSIPQSDQYQWNERSTYIKQPPYFRNLTKAIPPLQKISNARVLVKVNNFITTDHISPAGAIHPDSPAAQYLQSLGVQPIDFNSYGSRRGNHEVMIRGTFANTRFENQLSKGKPGPFTRLIPEGEILSIFDASIDYKKRDIPLIILAGKEYGAGSSRDWAAKGPALLGVKAIIAQSFERIHRSNLIGMGILPLQFTNNQTYETLGLTGYEHFEIPLDQLHPRAFINITANNIQFSVQISIDTHTELAYFQHGGIMPYIIRNLTC